MSIAITAKIFDGIVLGADSATTTLLQAAGQPPTSIVYTGGTKLFNLHRQLPLGAVTVGLGNIGSASMPALMKEFRRRLMHGAISLNCRSYRVEEIAHRLLEFLLERWRRSFPTGGPGNPLLVHIVGYGSDAEQPEEWDVAIGGDGSSAAPCCIRQVGDYGLWWAGAREPVSRLILGYSPRLEGLLRAAVEDSETTVPTLMRQVQEQLQQPLVLAPTPLSDAIDLVTHLVELAALWERLTPGPPVVGGEVEVATVTRYEGYKWVRRKHYYPAGLNPRIQEQHDGDGDDQAQG